MESRLCLGAGCGMAHSMWLFVRISLKHLQNLSLSLVAIRYQFPSTQHHGRMQKEPQASPTPTELPFALRLCK